VMIVFTPWARGHEKYLYYMCVEGFARCVASCDTRRKSGVLDRFDVVRSLLRSRKTGAERKTYILLPFTRFCAMWSIGRSRRKAEDRWFRTQGIFGTTGSIGRLIYLRCVRGFRSCQKLAGIQNQNQNMHPDRGPVLGKWCRAP